MTARCNPRKDGRAGFTLIELAVASSLILFLILATGQMILRSILSRQESDRAQVSAGLVSDKLEFLKSASFGDPDLTGFHEETVSAGHPPQPYLRRWEVADASPQLKKIVMECFPLGKPGKRTRAALYVSEILGF